MIANIIDTTYIANVIIWSPSMKTALAPRPDYGLDAPDVVRNLFIAGVAGVLLAFATWRGLVPATLRLPLPGVQLLFPLLSIGIIVGISCAVMGGVMLWGSRIGKLRRREWLLDLHHWTGHEQVLDVGCGRGLMLIGAAQRLSTGKACGIDIWRDGDLSGNSAQATGANARLAGVEQRVAVTTADMREIPFPDKHFDVIVSRAAIHNIDTQADRERAIAELARVLKPGGVALIDDIRHHRHYAAAFARHGCSEIHYPDSRLMRLLFTVLSWGQLQPAVLQVRKPA